MRKSMKLSKKQLKREKNKDSYEEISEKKTSKLGYIFLIMMTFFIIIVGEAAFSDLAKLPQEPSYPSYCIRDSVDNLELINSLSCPLKHNFNRLDKKFKLDKKIKKIQPQLQEIIRLNQNIEANEVQIEELEESVQALNREYNLSLQEKIANERVLIDKKQTKKQIVEAKARIKKLKNEIDLIRLERVSIISQITDSAEIIKSDYSRAKESYQDQEAWYKIKVFFLTLIFVLPFFVFSIYFYLKLKKRNSPYTIILTAITTAFSVLFFQVSIVFLYDILPRKWLGRIFKFFWELPFLHYIIYYCFVIFAIGIFGGIVYYIQSKVFSPLKVAVRRIKDRKCPKCSFPLDSNHTFCSNCGIKIYVKCENCGKQRVKYLPYCQECGIKTEDS